MATRGRVGLELADGSILSIYSHWDNYPEWAGRILRTHYNTREKVSSLIDGGDVSCLWTDDRWDGSGDGSYGPNHYAYRGEDCPPRLDANKYDYLSDGEEYAYIFTLENTWICYDRHQFEENTMPTVAEIPSVALAV
jgi:hypothetical protein